jgi:rhodanese-related sulfurtransferase
MDFILQNWMLVSAIIFVIFLILFEPMRRRMYGIETANVYDAVSLSNHQNAIFVDVRESKEMANGVINGAYRIPLSSFDKNIGQIEKFKDSPVIVYCRSGNRSLSAATRLKKKEFKQVYNLAGGILAWQKESLPLEK